MKKLLILVVLLLSSLIYAQERVAHPLKIWLVSTTVKPKHTIYVYKFQVDKEMICKAFVQTEQSKETSSFINDSVSVAVSTALTSLGDVPCER